MTSPVDPMAALHQMAAKLDAIDELFHRSEESRDLHERLTAGAAGDAEKAARQARKLVRTVVRVVTFALLLWTPLVAYGAIWFHELQRNNCYPVAAILAGGPIDEPWYCSLFPGTGRHAPQE